METTLRSRLTEPVDRPWPFEGNFTRTSVSEILLADVLSPPPVAPSRDPENNNQAKLFAVLSYERAEVFDQLAVNDDPYARILLLQEDASLNALQTSQERCAETAVVSFHQLLASQAVAKPIVEHADVSLIQGDPLAILKIGSDAHQEAGHASPARAAGLNTKGLPDPFPKLVIGKEERPKPIVFLEASFGIVDELMPTVPNLVPEFKLPVEATDPDSDDRIQITDDPSGLKSIPRPQRAMDKAREDYNAQGLTPDVDREFISAIRISDADWDAFADQPKIDELLRQLSTGSTNGQPMTIVERRRVHSKLLSEFQKSSRPVIVRMDYGDALKETHKADAARVQYVDAYSKSVVLPVREMRQEISQIDRDLKQGNLKAEDKNDLTRMRIIIAGTGRNDGLVDLPATAQSKTRR